VSREMLSDVGVFSPLLPEFGKENSDGLPLSGPSAGVGLRVGLPMLGADRRASICLEFSEV